MEDVRTYHAFYCRRFGQPIDAANSAGELSDEIVDLTNKYLELSEAVKTDASAKDDLLSIQDELIKKLDLEKGRIDGLVEKYGNLTDAIKAASIESLQSAERDLRGGLNAYEDRLIDDADEGFFGTDSISISRYAGKKIETSKKNYIKDCKLLNKQVLSALDLIRHILITMEANTPRGLHSLQVFMTIYPLLTAY